MKNNSAAGSEAPEIGAGTPAKRHAKARGAAALTLLLAAAGAAQAQQQPSIPSQSYGAGQSSASASYAPLPAFRSPQNYVDVLAGVTYADNVKLTPAGKVSDTLGVVGLEVDYARQGSKLDLDARGAVYWVEYLHHTYPRTAFGNVNGTALWGKTADIIQWVATETFGQAAINPLASPTPDNQQNVNYFTTGPTLNFMPGLRDRLSVDARYSNITYQSSPFGANVFTGGATLSHLLSSASSIALIAVASRTELTGYPDLSGIGSNTFDVRYGFLEYKSAIGRMRLKADAGYTSVHQGEVTDSTPYVSLELDRRVSYSSTVYLRARNGYSTTADSLRNSFVTNPYGGAGLEYGLGVTTASPFKQSMATLGWTFDRARTTFSLWGSGYSNRYAPPDARYDQNVWVVSATLERRISPTVSVTLSAWRNQVDYQSSSARTEDMTASAEVTKHFRRARLTLRYLRDQRTGSGSITPGVAPVPNPNAPSSFNDNRVGAYITYDVVGHRTGSY